MKNTVFNIEIKKTKETGYNPFEVQITRKRGYDGIEEMTLYGSDLKALAKQAKSVLPKGALIKINNQKGYDKV